MCRITHRKWDVLYIGRNNKFDSINISEIKIYNFSGQIAVFKENERLLSCLILLVDWLTGVVKSMKTAEPV